MGPHIYARPWAEGDLQRLQEAESSFSVSTLTSRFLTGNTRLPPVYLARLRRPVSSSRSWLGHVAFVDGKLIGMAECAWPADSSQPGDLAVLVADRWQRRGVGRLVVNGLLDQVEAAGITHLEAVADAVNVGCHALVRSIGREGNRSDDWSVRSWVTSGQRHFELRRRRVPETADHGQWLPSPRVTVDSHRSRPPALLRTWRSAGLFTRRSA
ncbi:GNAT family N-acetyltransferase [Actinoplanes sp. NPDC048988]|uniref:GNAT family N-acetyltransferase n=1 Tax=Actinoplanes sp. NPDC048988 TaxID=3363901 RepID=UPI00371B9FC0